MNHFGRGEQGVCGAAFLEPEGEGEGRPFNLTRNTGQHSPVAAENMHTPNSGG